MKTIIILLSFSVFLYGQIYSQTRDSLMIEDSWQKRDTTPKEKTVKDSLNDQTEMIIIHPENPPSNPEVKIIGTPSSNHDTEVIYYSSKKNKNWRRSNDQYTYARFSGSWVGVGFGFTNFTDTDYSRYEGYEFMELDHARSFTLQGNIFEQGISLSRRNNHGFLSGIGVEYQRLMFNQDISIEVDQSGILQPLILPESWTVKRSSLKILYLTLPILYEFQFRDRTNYRRKHFFISAGAVGGMRIFSRTKVTYKENGKKEAKKDDDSFNLFPFKADLHARVGFRNLFVWGSYTLTPIFGNSKGPELHPYSVGIGYRL